MCIFSLYLTYSVYNLDLINTLICIQKIVIVMLSPMCGSTSQTNIAGVFPLSMHSWIYSFNMVGFYGKF